MERRIINEEKQVTIINAILDCFGKYGNVKASVKDIAVSAGVSKALVFQYFGNKKRLYRYLPIYVDNSFQQTDFGQNIDIFDRFCFFGLAEAKYWRKPLLAQSQSV